MSELTRAQRMRKKVRRCAEGWWYENEGGIEVYLTAPNGTISHGVIYWSELLRAAQRSCGREVIVKPRG
jgi:hypothetical protein